ncbi:helix-turn-helix transcriptional regulator [Alcaligenes sp. SDU_A2]|uniref:helix-turn-helix transcriptional regulator n=1 Tax=Alcaligenes sp. SDU_A2 TaxID=3136634 RepID=UPI00311ED1D0
MQALLESLIKARKARGWTQGQLAQRAMLSRSTVQQVESGATDPYFSTLYEMARALGMELMTVPGPLRVELESFVQAGGRWLGQPPGINAPLSIVDEIVSGQLNLKR